MGSKEITGIIEKGLKSRSDTSTILHRCLDVACPGLSMHCGRDVAYETCISASCLLSAMITWDTSI